MSEKSAFVNSFNSFLFFSKKHLPTTERQVFKHWYKWTLPFQKTYSLLYSTWPSN